MTNTVKRKIIFLYKNRIMTIRELARENNLSYEEVRKVIRDEGFSNGKVRISG